MTVAPWIQSAEGHADHQVQHAGRRQLTRGVRQVRYCGWAEELLSWRLLLMTNGSSRQARPRSSIKGLDSCRDHL